jgi:uncharacterized protein DUF5317
MTKRSLLAASRQICLMVFAVAGGLFFGYRFITGTPTTYWMTPIAVIVAFLGGVLNLVAVILNKGKMPVRTNKVPERYKHSHAPVHRKTRVPILGDWIRIGGGYHSPGDVCIYIGITVVVADQLVGIVVKRL